MINLKKSVPIVKETIVLSEEEQMNLDAFIHHISQELNKARNEEELLDMLDWAKRRITNGL